MTSTLTWEGRGPVSCCCFGFSPSAALAAFSGAETSGFMKLLTASSIDVCDAESSL